MQAIPPDLDPTPIFEYFRGSYGSELLTAAVSHFGVFDRLQHRRLTLQDLQHELGLQRRPAIVLTTALRAMTLLETDREGGYGLTELSRKHLVPGTEHFVGDYLGLAAESPGVLAMVERLRSNSPANARTEDTGAAYIFRSGIDSAMEQEESARRLTLALSGRAKNVAPVLASRLNMTAGTLLDVGGGSGIYSIAALQQFPAMQAIVFDSREVLKVAAEFARDYGVADRMQLVEGDMFEDPFPAADSILLSNILHDWDELECQQLVSKCASSLKSGGQLVIHDVFLNDELDGPLPIALYSAALFSLTQGRAYSAAEYRSWLRTAGMVPGELQPTLIHCSALSSLKP